MNAALKRYKWNDATFFSIVDKWSCPVDPYLSAYLNTFAGYALSTQCRYGHELLFVLKHFSSQDIDLVQRVASGTLLNMSEYSSFYYRCAQIDEPKTGKKRRSVFSNIEDKTIRNILASNGFQSSKVSNSTHQGRIRRLRSYLAWLFGQFHDVSAVSEHIEDKMHKLTQKMIADERSLNFQKTQEVRNPEDDAIPPEVFCRLLDVIRPSSPENPFSRSNRLRNYLIVEVLLDTGIRRGALGKLKISDLRSDRSGASLWIYPAWDDPEDPRLNKPNQKTKAHLAYIKPYIMDALHFYIEHVRNQIPGSHTHDFLFVSDSNARGTRGQPLATNSINEIFYRLSKVLGYRVHPHLLRHMWNDLFDDNADRFNFSFEQIEDARKYAMGWSASSKMADIYNDRRTHQRVRIIMNEHQESIDSKK